MSTPFEYVFPTIRGLQAGKAYYISMCPLRLIPRIFLFDDEELAPELRAQRTLNRSRVPEIAHYLVQQRDSYVFSAITASIDAPVTFEALSEDAGTRDIGRLRIPMTARFVINDGQHRRAAIEMALKEAPELGDETIAVVFFLDPSLLRCQQMFSDLNRYAVRPSPSLNILYNHRDGRDSLARDIVHRVRAFQGMVELEGSTLAMKSRKLFTLSAIALATRTLLADRTALSYDEQLELAVRFWEGVAQNMPDWASVRERKVPAGELRRDSIAGHGLVLAALGRVGRALIAEGVADFSPRLVPLRTLDWSRANAALWEGRATVGGRVSKAGANVTLTSAALKVALGIALSPDEVASEKTLQRSGAHNG